MEEGASVDWDAFEKAAIDGRMLEPLAKLPCERWAEQDGLEYTLLHYACLGPNVAAAVALVQSGLVDVNARNRWEDTPAHFAVECRQPRVLEVLCAAGADLRASNKRGVTPIDFALSNILIDGDEYVRVLVANGVRLRTVREEFRKTITSVLVAFERGVLRCRSAVAAMLRVKRVGPLWRWDKFLLREVALAIWATRYNEEWTN